MKLSTDKKGIPIFMMGDKPVPYQEGIRYIKRINGLKSKDMAHLLGLSTRTIEGWLNKKKPGIRRLLELKSMLDSNGYIKKGDM